MLLLKPKTFNRDVDEQGLFDHMVNNAFDFLNQALDEFETNRHFSVVHFATAIELFLKARLLKEHWSLVLKDIDRANWSDFTRGMSATVTPSTAKRRLQEIAKDPVPEDVWKVFEGLAKHRNRVIHFGKEPAENEEHQRHLIDRLTVEQYQGWVSLQELLTKNWEKHFQIFKDQISNTERKMLGHRQYLEKKYDSIKSEIDSLHADGWRVRQCSKCSFNALVYEDEADTVSLASCRVCTSEASLSSVKCPFEGCGAKIYFEFNTGLPTSCPSCEVEFYEDDIGTMLDTGEPTTSNNYFDKTPINCGCCRGYHTVVEHHQGHICVECFVFANRVGYCEWCHEGQLGGLSEFSFINGCNFCDGNHELDV